MEGQATALWHVSRPRYKERIAASRAPVGGFVNEVMILVKLRLQVDENRGFLGVKNSH